MKILISVDSAESARTIIQEAAPFIKGFPDAEIHIYTVLDLASVAVGSDAADSSIMNHFKKEGGQISAIAAGILGERDFTFDAEYGHTVDAILHKVESLGCSLLIMGTHGRTGFDHLLMGSVASKVLRLSQVNTLVIPMRRKTDK